MMRVTLPWTQQDDDALRDMHGQMTISEIGARLGRTRPSVRARITRLGIAKRELWTPKEERMVIDAYSDAGAGGVLRLAPLADALGRSKANIVRKAKSLGMETNMRRPYSGKRAERKTKYATDAQRKEAASKRMIERHREHGHPMLGKAHTAEALRKMSEASARTWAAMSEEEREAHMQKAARAAFLSAESGPPKIARGTWMAGWREVGGKRNYYRSRWEANYARYLEWLKSRGEISEWLHEPETFWFEAIKRGVRSYKPDFRVWDNRGGSSLHEVKGWMDARSKTTLKRMAKYYPSEVIVIIDERQYRSIKKAVQGVIPDWEN
jgi:hypothetical protein